MLWGSPSKASSGRRAGWVRGQSGAGAGAHDRCCRSGLCALPPGAPAELRGAGGLPPDAEGEVEAVTPGACCVVLGVVPVDRADGRQASKLARTYWVLSCCAIPPAQNPQRRCHGTRALLLREQALGEGQPSSQWGHHCGAMEVTKQCSVVTLTTVTTVVTVTEQHSTPRCGPAVPHCSARDLPVPAPSILTSPVRSLTRTCRAG